MEELPIWKRKLPSFDHRLLNDAANLLTEFYKEHIHRDINDGKLTPANYWALLRGFLIAAMQTYAGICLLLSKERPKPLMMQAGVLNRALFENLATVLSLTETPERAEILLRESIKMYATQYKRFFERFGAE